MLTAEFLYAAITNLVPAKTYSYIHWTQVSYELVAAYKPMRSTALLCYRADESCGNCQDLSHKLGRIGYSEVKTSGWRVILLVKMEFPF
jgi:hypothetical protein